MRRGLEGICLSRPTGPEGREEFFLTLRPPRMEGVMSSGKPAKIKLKDIIGYLEKMRENANDADKSRMARAIDLLQRCDNYELEL